jgi:superfamily II DNA or RNA helicase
MNNIKYYPKTDDDNFNTRLYNKREFYIGKQDKQKDYDTYDELENERDRICGNNNLGLRELLPQQAFLSNFINPETPYNGLLMFHATGVGKTCAAISIAENFKEQALKYNTKIYILVTGPTLIDNFYKNIIGPCTGNTYMNNMENISMVKKKKEIKKAKQLVHKYYTIMSYKRFTKKIIGEKSKDRNNKYIKINGKYKRELSANPITSLSNTLIIVDEAHNLIDNARGEALQMLIDNPDSKNLRTILLTATPMKNHANDIVSIMNFILPKGKRINEKKIFDVNTNQILDTGLSYLKKKTKGYISYLSTGSHIFFPKRMDIGTIPKELKYTKVIQCEMKKYQLESYIQIYNEEKKDPLSRKLSNVSNIALFGLDDKHKKLINLNGNNALDTLNSNIKYNYDTLLRFISDTFSNIKNDINNNFVYLDDHDIINGTFLNEKYLANFSNKFYTALQYIKNNKDGTIFVYSNMVGVGVQMFGSMLKMNGYKKFNVSDKSVDSTDYRCYKCNKYKSKHTKEKHDFLPATYVILTGESLNDDDSNLERQQILNIFNDKKNMYGQQIKLLLGSKILSEGTDLKNITEIHILDTWYNLTRIYQIVGRGIRQCSHYNVMTKQNMYPVVKVYKYVSILPKSYNKIISNDVRLYKVAEYKYLQVKIIERAIKENSIDCAYNKNINQKESILKQNKNCNKHKYECPEECEFMQCEYKCDDPILNKTYWKENKNDYLELDVNNIDNSTFINKLYKNELNKIKNIIKKMYKFNIYYKLNDIIIFVKNNYTNTLKKVFNVNLIYKALTQYCPTKEYEFNQLTDFIIDKFDRNGYLIQRGDYYIFQPFGYDTKLPIYLRDDYELQYNNNITINEFLQTKNLLQKVEHNDEDPKYNFYSKFNITNDREEHDIVGFIKYVRIKGTNRYKTIFNLRLKRKKDNVKKREKGLPSLDGANCLTKSKYDLIQISNKYLSLNIDKQKTIKQICNVIKEKLLELEKNTKGKKKKKYVYIQNNHPDYVIPYNLEDRIDIWYKNIKDYFKNNSETIQIEINNNNIEINNNGLNKNNIDYLKSYKAKLIGNKWNITIE